MTRDGQTLGSAVRVEVLRSDANDAAPSVSTNQQEIYFWSGRSDPTGDIYVATRQNALQPWSAPENLGPPINTSSAEQQPQLSHGGRTLLFASNRPGSVVNPVTGLPSGDLWMSTRTPGCR